ncbi:cytidylate kinase-like family protein [Thermophilibacter sp.]
MNYVICIARGFGSGGKTIATHVGERLGIPVFEDQVLTMASERSGLNERLFREADERLRGSAIMRRLRQTPGHLQEALPHERAFTSDENLFAIQAHIISDLAASQSCVIVGKCADVVLANRSNVVSIFITAPEQEAVATIMRRCQCDEARARELVSKTDRYRSDYYRYYSGGHAWKDPDNWDLIVNTARTGRERAVGLICSYVNLRFGPPDAQGAADGPAGA